MKKVCKLGYEIVSVGFSNEIYFFPLSKNRRFVTAQCIDDSITKYSYTYMLIVKQKHY